MVQLYLNNENILRLVGHNYTAGFLDLHSAFQRITEVENNKENNIKKQIETDNKAVKKKKIGKKKNNKKKNSSKKNNKTGNSKKKKLIKIK